jgi:hypothetical protein
MAGNLSVQLPDLSQLLGGVGGYAMGQQKDMAFKNNQMNQDSQLQDFLFNEQNNPIKLRQAGLDADTTAARLPGEVAVSAGKTRDQKILDSIPLDVQTKAKLTDIYAKMSKEELQQLDDHMNKGLMSPDPEVQKIAQAALEHTAPFRKVRYDADIKQERDIALAKLKHTQDMARDKQNIDAGRWKRAGKVQSIEMTIATAKSARERHQALIDAATIATQDGDEALAESYNARAAAIRPQAEAEIANLQPRPGSPSLPALAGIPVNPNISVAPPGTAPAAGAKPTTPAEAQAAGWTMHVDAKGNRAYVSPDKKNFVEIK